MPLNISQEALAIILATFLGPVFAVIVTLWRESRNELHGRRTHIFRTLMSTRRSVISEKHVEALNLVEVDFFGVKKVLDAHRAYMNKLNDGGPEDEKWNGGRLDLLTALLHEMSKTMKMPMGEIDLRNGGYAPVAWDVSQQYRNFVSQVIKGEAALPISLSGVSEPIGMAIARGLDKILEASKEEQKANALRTTPSSDGAEVQPPGTPRHR